MKWKAVFVIFAAFLFLSAVSYAERAVKVKPKKDTGSTAVQHDTKYYAIIIGSNNYKYLPKLKTAIADAKAVEEILKEKYGFTTKLLIDAGRKEILDAINEMRKKLGSNDNLLIYYAGHGEYDKNVDRAYWLPADAERDNPSNWIIADDITSNIKRISSKHILLVSDSCYSGTLTRAAVVDLKGAEKDEYIKKMLERPSRTLMASGGNEPVADSGGGGHSVFASAFLKALKETDKNYFTAEELFHGRVKEMVAGKSDQVPEYSTIKNSGHDGGDFVFQLAKASVSGTGGYTAPLTPVEINKPSGKDFKIDDLEKEAKEIEKNKAAWNGKLKEMKEAYGKVKTFEQGASPADRKAAAWQRFLETFSQDNPYSQEDDTMRQEAEERISYWNNQQQIAMAPAKKLLDKITGKAFKDPTTNMEFVSVKGGCYQMGDTFGDGEANEKPVHEVCVDDFYIGKYEVTVGEFKKFANDTGYSTDAEKGDGCFVWTGSEWKKESRYNWRNLNFSQDDRHPVACVSWNDAVAFTDWLKRKTGKSYRLPTEAEWEYAAKSGGKNEKYSGSNDIDSVAWYDKNSGSKTHPVGAKQPNGLGLYDMSGNVWEWVTDWYDENYYKNSPKDNPKGPSSGSYRVRRGGGWGYNARSTGATDRNCYEPAGRSDDDGFRLAFPAK